MPNLRSLLEVIKKDVKVLIRSKFSSLIIILGPLLIIFLVGIAFDTTGYHNIKIAVYSQKYSDLAESYIAKLSNNAFRVYKVSSKEECISLVKGGTFHSCVVFSPNLTIGNKTKSKIEIYIDNSKLNIAWLIKDAIFEKITNRSQEISKSLLQTLLDTFEDINNELSIRKKSIIELTTKNDELITDSNTIITTGENMKVNLKESDFKLSNFSSSLSSLSFYLSRYKDKAEESVASLSSSLDAIQSEAQQLDINESLKEGLYNAISAAQYHLSNVTYNISHEGSYQLAQSELDALSSYIDSIKAALENLKTQISHLGSTRNEVLSRAQGMKQKLVDQLGKIMEIQQGINKIEDAIANLKVKDSELITEPIKTTVSPILVKKSHLSFLFPTMLVLIVMFVSLLMSSTVVQMERNSQAHFRNLITPSNTLVFTFGNFLVTLVIAILQVVVVLGITALFFHTSVFSNFFTLILVSVVASSFFILLGIIISSIFNSEETSLLAVLSAGLLLLFVSGTILPLESVPSNLRGFIDLSPFVLTHNLYRDLMLFKPNFSDISSPLGYLVLYTLILFLLVLIMQNLFDKLSLKLHLRHHIPFKVAGKHISGKKTLKSVFIKESKQMEYLRELIHDCNKLLSKASLHSSDMEKLKKMYVRALDIYDSLSVSERRRVFHDIESIYKKLNQLNSSTMN